MSICACVKKKYVFMFLCLRLKELFHYVLMSNFKTKEQKNRFLRTKICHYVLVSNFKTEEQKNRFLRTNLCLYVLMSKSKELCLKEVPSLE